MKHEREYFKLQLAGKFDTYDRLTEHMKMLMSQRGWRKTKGSGRMKQIKLKVPNMGLSEIYRHLENSDEWHTDIQLVWNDINDPEIYKGL